MNLETLYVLGSAGLLTFTAAIWSSTGWANIAVKLTYTLAAFAGAIVVARTLSL